MKIGNFLLSVLLFLTVISSCTHIEVPQHELCVIGPDSCICVPAGEQEAVEYDLAHCENYIATSPEDYAMLMNWFEKQLSKIEGD